MTLPRKFGLLVLAALVGMVGAEFGERQAVPGIYSVVTPAQARVGRPATPVSVAGVARRTTRRCVAGVYYC